METSLTSAMLLFQALVYARRISFGPLAHVHRLRRALIQAFHQILVDGLGDEGRKRSHELGEFN